MGGQVETTINFDVDSSIMEYLLKQLHSLPTSYVLLHFSLPAFAIPPVHKKKMQQ